MEPNRNKTLNTGIIPTLFINAGTTDNNPEINVTILGECKPKILTALKIMNLDIIFKGMTKKNKFTLVLLELF